MGRFDVDATVYRTLSRCRLRLADTYTRQAGHWIATASIATTQ